VCALTTCARCVLFHHDAYSAYVCEPSTTFTLCIHKRAAN
jgi:hypothetical protein